MVVDKHNKFEEIFEEYFKLLDDEKMIVACYLAENAGKIAIAKPYLMEEITSRLLNIENSLHKKSTRDLIRTPVIDSLAQIFT